MLGEHLQAGRMTGERETQRVEPFPGALPQLRVEAPFLPPCASRVTMANLAPSEGFAPALAGPIDPDPQ